MEQFLHSWNLPKHIHPFSHKKKHICFCAKKLDQTDIKKKSAIYKMTLKNFIGINPCNFNNTYQLPLQQHLLITLLEKFSNCPSTTEAFKCIEQNY